VLIDMSREIHDVPATVVTTSGDVALLRIGRGNLQPVAFYQGLIGVGASLAEAGYYRSDEVGTQVARLLYPSTVSALTDKGRVIAFDNVNIREGLSGGPVFDATTGAVEGMVTSRSADGPGGYAISGPLVLYYFLSEQGVGVAKAPAGSTFPAGPVNVALALPYSVPVARGSNTVAAPASGAIGFNNDLVCDQRFLAAAPG
jgi:hypothetical protein